MTTAEQKPTGMDAVPDWGAGHVSAPKPAPALLLLAGAIVLVAGLAALVAPLGGIVIGASLVVASVVWLVTRGRAILDSAGARPMEPHEAPRFENVASGLAADIGIPRPGLWIVEQGGPNAVVAWAGGPQIGLTKSLLESYTRTEVEAVVAHALVRIASGEARATTLATGLRPLPVGSARVGGALDIAAAALTRYPPALASALEKAVPRTGRYAAAWFAANDPSHVPVEERSKALGDI